MEPSEVDAALAPARNPDVGKPARAVQGVVSTREPAKTHFAGTDLIPDLAAKGRVSGTVKEYRYWVGVTPSCPVESIDLAGVNFPKVNELLIDDPLRTDVKRRVPVIGALVWINEAKIRRLRERLARTVIRFIRSDQGQKEEPNTGENVGDVHRRPRRGHLITIPTDAEIAERKRRGKPTREYVYRNGDVPAGRYMFAQICEDQARGSRGDYYPEVLETTGLDWPDTIEDSEAKNVDTLLA